jgi:ABC-type dipeptide/oligopeptide/nickel transport system permease subunit
MGENMATRKEKMNFTLKRLKGFFTIFRKSKRGMVGVAIIAFFSLLAILAPIITSYAPIYPMWHAGEFPALYGRGPQVASDMCAPYWYKYLPWISRGTLNIEETFYTNLTQAGGRTFQLFGRTGQPAVDSWIILDKRAVQPPKIDVTFPNGTTRVLSFPEEWQWNYRDPAIIKVPDTLLFPERTSLNVTYTSGTDLVENVEPVPDFHFHSNQTFQENWNWNTTLNSIVVKYNNQNGTENDGCIEIAYNPQASDDPSKGTRALLWRRFEYPYWQPPKSFWGYLSTMVAGDPTASVNITVAFYRDGGEEVIPVATYNKTVALGYSDNIVPSTTPEVWALVGAQNPTQTIFPRPANYSLMFAIEFSGNKTTSVHLDNLGWLLYGNTFGLLGTDNDLGYPRDLFSTLVYGTRVSLLVGVLTAVFSTLIGLFLGLAAGYLGGFVDEAIMRIADLFLVIPTLPLFIILIVALSTVTSGPVSFWNIILVLTLFGWMGFARTVRSMVLSLRERTFIEAAKASGASNFYIINRHVLPNVFALVYITLATAVPGAIVTEASLSWLGLGDPLVPSWGKVLYDFESSGVVITKGLTDYWFWMFPACIAIALLATAFILMGFALDETLNPRLRQRR